MANEIQKGSVPAIPSVGAPITQVNQYGDRSVHADHVENLNVTVIENQGSPTEDENGVPFVPLTPTRYDSTTRIIYLGTEEVKLPVQLTPQSSISPQELPYVNALCEVYAEKINGVVTPDTIGTLSNTLRRNFAEQRKAYYSAESVHRSVREVFSDGDKQFQALKTDAYDGISDTLFDDRHTSGYGRLLAVLDKVTNITLSKSSFMNIIGLIANLEKKGICHILVNDGTIKSCVNIDE